ncbi:MAG: hypothetical protein ACK45F_08930, partial [bacterium]
MRGRTGPGYSPPRAPRPAREAAYNGPVDLLLVSNGPGELTGWAFPLARALRRLDRGVSLHLALPPCQYATGRERQVAESSQLFDRVYGPTDVVRLVLTGPRPPSRCVIHVGGDLWYTARLSRRAGCPAVAYVERDLITRRHRAFARIATHTEGLAERLVRRGVPADKVQTVGDLRADAVDSVEPAPEAEQRVLLLLPGSRPGIFRDLAPLMLEVGRLVRERLPEFELALVPSPFLSEEAVSAAVREQQVFVARTPEQRRSVLARTALAVTLPGTSNVELGLLGVPMLVWLPLYDPSRVPLEGLVEWLARVPVAGRALKAWVVRRGLRRLHYVSPVNAAVGEPVVDEEVGHAPPSA